MLLRHLVHRFLRSAAEQRLRSAMDSHSQEAQAESVLSEKCDIVVAFALPIEAGGLVDLASDIITIGGTNFVERRGTLAEHQISIMETGVGMAAAARATADVIALRQPEWVISAGFAGSLRPEIKRGHLLMPNSVIDTDHRTLGINLQFDSDTLHKSPSLHVGRLLTVDSIVRDPKHRIDLAAQYDAIGVDMETWAVAETCRLEKVRFLSTRIVSDGANEKLPPQLEKLLDQPTTAARLGAAAGAVFRRPSIVKEMWQLKKNALLATDRLARFLTGVIEQLP